MERVTEEQREHWEAVAAQATAKLEAFRDGLTADERAYVGLALWQGATDVAGTDESVAGFAANNPFVKEVAKAVVINVIWEGLKAVAEWASDNSRPMGPGNRWSPR